MTGKPSETTNSGPDLSALAVRRDDSAPDALGRRRHLVSRYVLPGILLLGFVIVLAWAARDVLLPARPVTVIPVLASFDAVQQSGTPLFKAAGWIEPRPTPIRIPALANGYVDRLLVVEDQPVKAGEPIAHLVKDDAQLSLRAAEATRDLRLAELQQVRATLAAAQTNFDFPVALQADSAAAAAQLASIETEIATLPFATRRADARLSVAREDLDGKRRAGDVVSGIDVERANSELNSATALVKELNTRLPRLQRERDALVTKHQALLKQLELKSAETQALAESNAQLKAAQARVEQADVTVAEAKLRLDRMTVRAPVDGRVLHLLAHPGTHTVGMGHQKNYDATTIVTLYRPDELQVRVDVRFEDLPRSQLGQPVLIESPALSKPLKGTVLFPTSIADIQKNTLELKVAIDSPPKVLKPEMLVDVTFLAVERPNDGAETSADQAQPDLMQLFVPRQLVEQDAGGSFVWVANLLDGVANRQNVTTGSTTMGTLIEITDGLTVASRVIASGRDGLRDGERIRVTGEDSALGVGSGE